MLQIAEIWKSRHGRIGRGGSQQYAVQVWGDPEADNAEDPGVVISFALQSLGAICEFGYFVDNIEIDHTEPVVPGRWIVKANYRAPSDSPQTDTAKFSFRTGGGTKHIQASIQTRAVYTTSGLTATNTFGGAINREIVNGAPVVRGVDVHSPTYDFQIVCYVPPDGMTSAYLTELKGATCCVNSDTVVVNADGLTQSFAPGELLFLGCDGSKRQGMEDWELALQFSASANLSGQTIAGIGGVNSNGWDYVWTYFAPTDTTDADGNPVLGTVATYVSVEQVYPYVPLSAVFPSVGGASNSLPVWLQDVLIGGTGIPNF